MAKVRTTIMLDEDVLRWVKVRAGCTGKGDSAVIEERSDVTSRWTSSTNRGTATTWRRARRTRSPSRPSTGRGRGAFELVVSPLLLAELERALAYPKLRERITAEDAARIVGWLRRAATAADDPDGPPPLSSRDSGDDYLLALAVSRRAALVSGDKDLLSLAGDLPIYSPADYLRAIDDPA